MKHSRVLVASWISFVAVVVVWFSVFAVPAAAQSAGQNFFIALCSTVRNGVSVKNPS